jgi:hypothetical protein
LGERQESGVSFTRSRYINGDDPKKEKGPLSRIGMWRINALAASFGALFDALAEAGFFANDGRV